jgi:hypothetical protein
MIMLMSMLMIMQHCKGDLYSFHAAVMHLSVCSASVMHLQRATA